MACNYNADATDEDGSCTYAEDGYDCDGNCLADAADGVCKEFEIAAARIQRLQLQRHADSGSTSTYAEATATTATVNCWADVDGDGVMQEEFEVVMSSVAGATACNYNATLRTKMDLALMLKRL